MDEMQSLANDNTDGAKLQSGNADEQEWTDKGNAAAQQGDYEGAAEAFEQAVAINPSDARARYNLALAQQYLGDSELAIAGYRDRKSTRLNSSHSQISYAVFCLKKKKNISRIH